MILGLLQEIQNESRASCNVKKQAGSQNGNTHFDGSMSKGCRNQFKQLPVAKVGRYLSNKISHIRL